MFEVTCGEILGVVAASYVWAAGRLDTFYTSLYTRTRNFQGVKLHDDFLLKLTLTMPPVRTNSQAIMALPSLNKLLDLA
jgi:hypothetical protein